MPQNPFDQFGTKPPRPRNPFDELGNPTPTPVPSSNPFDQFGAPPEEPGFFGKAISSAVNSQVGQAVISTLSPVLDFISRPSYGSAKFADSLADESKDIFDAIIEGIGEVIDPKQRLSYSDVIKRRFPNFAIENPKATSILGFVGDVALDPTSYLGLGLAKNGVQIGGKVLTKTIGKTFTEGVEVAARKAFIGNNGVIELLDDLPNAIIRDEKVLKGIQKSAAKFDKNLKGTQVVDDIGNPKIVYRGSEGTIDKGVTYYTELPEVASDIYAGEGVVSPYFLKIKNAAKYEDVAPKKVIDSFRDQGLDVVEGDKFVDVIKKLRDTVENPLEGRDIAIVELKKLGYDGIEFLSDDGGTLHKQFVVFDAEKQAINALSGKGVVAKNTLQRGTIPKANQLNVENRLTEAGYFDAVRNKQEEIEKFLNNLTGSTNIPLAETIAKDETLADLKRFGKQRLTEDLYTSEVRERLEQRILKMVELQPELKEKFFAPSGVYAKIGVPFGKQRDLVKILGLETLSNKVSAIGSYIESSSRLGKAVVRGGKAVREAFDRDYGLNAEYVTARNDLDNELFYIVQQREQTARKLYKEVGSDGSQRIQSAMSWIDDQTRYLEQLRVAGGSAITDDDAAGIFQRGIEKFKLTPTERAITVNFAQNYKEAALAEMKAGLLKNNLVNYSPRGYELIDDADEFSLIRSNTYAGIPKEFLSSSQKRKYATNAEAEAAGFKPELDAVLLYTQRMMQSQRALAIKQFKDNVNEIFGTLSVKPEYQKRGILPAGIVAPAGIPQRVIDDMKMIGESVFPSGMSETSRDLLKGYDTLQGWFKRAATTVRPSFAIKQLFSNTFQSALVTGAKAFKGFDPRAAADAALLLGSKGKGYGLPDFLSGFMFKNFRGNEGVDAILAERVVLQKIIGDEALNDYASKFKLRNGLGQNFIGTELVDAMLQRRVIRSVDSTGEAFSRNFKATLSKDQNTYKNVVGELAKVWNHASMVEDYSNAMLFLNGVRMGYSFDDAAKLTKTALFDYAKGLSNVERDLIKRVIPFYSFQRFAIPYIFKQVIKQPGTVATTEKFVKLMEKLLVTGEEVTPGEQNIFNDSYLVEQPRLFTGFDKTGKGTLNVLNNLTPFDVLNFFVFNKEGKLDLERTAQKSVLGALTPFIKVPIQGLIDKDFFTEKTIEQASTLGNLEGSIGKLIPQAAKDLMGWESRTNEVSGKTTTYINPFFSYYSMQFFPFLRDIVKPNVDAELNPNVVFAALQAGMNAIVEASFPIKSTQINLKEMDEYSMLKTNKEYKEIQKNIYGAFLRGSKNDVEKNQEKLLRLIEVFDQNRKLRDAGQVRGTGIGQAPEEAQQEVSTPIPNIQQQFK